MRQLVFVARRRIEEGETIFLPDDGCESPDLVAAGVVDTYEGENADLQIAAVGDVTPAEAHQAVGRMLAGGGVTIDVPIPSTVRTFNDFFDQMPGQFAETMWNREAKVCSRCGEQKMFCAPVGSRMLCPECKPLES